MRFYLYIIALTLYTITLLALAASTGSARDYCPADEGTIYYTTSGGTATREPCPRTPDATVPRCDYAPATLSAWVDSAIIYLTDSSGDILIW